MMSVVNVFPCHPKTMCSSALASQPFFICMWLEASGNGSVKLLAKAPAMSGLLMLEDITNTKAFGNNGTYQSSDPFTVAVIKRRLCSRAHP